MPEISNEVKGKVEGPTLTPELKTRSDDRMKSIMGSVSKSAPHFQQKFASEKGVKPPGAALPSSVEKVEESPKVEKPSSPSVQVEKPAEKGVEPSSTQPKEVKEKDTKVVVEPILKEGKPDWEATARSLSTEKASHQSRADKIQHEIGEKEKQWKTEREELDRYKTTVEEFTKDPVKFIQERLPDLGEKLSVAGDPVKMIEVEVGKFAEILQSEYKKTFGEDWQFSETDAIKPGTPSFRFRLAVDSKIAEVRDKHTKYVSGQKDLLARSSQEKMAEVEKIKSDFGFTDDDIKQADEFLSKEKISWYKLYKLALLDKIIQVRLSGIVSPPPPPPDISQASGSVESIHTKKPEISEQGRAIISRIGTGRR